LVWAIKGKNKYLTILAGSGKKRFGAALPQNHALLGLSALPPDVRRGLCPAVSHSIDFGLCPWSGFSPATEGRARTRGAARTFAASLTGGAKLTLAATGFAVVMGGPLWAAMAGGLSIAMQVGAWLTERRLDAKDNSRGPNREVAILYNMQKTFGE
jgi:hypothetical protein